MINTLDVEKFCKILEKKGNKKKLQLALQSFFKRNIYSEIYYRQFLEKSEEKNLRLVSIDHSRNIESQYEAPAVAFLANAHALIDAFPYVVYLSLRPLKFINKKKEPEKIKSNRCGWKDDFLAAMDYTYPKHSDLSTLFSLLMNHDDFKLLKTISNNNKHKFLVPIENIDLKFNLLVTNLATDETEKFDAEELFLKIHNNLLPKIFELYNELSKVCMIEMNYKE